MKYTKNIRMFLYTLVILFLIMFGILPLYSPSSIIKEESRHILAKENAVFNDTAKLLIEKQKIPLLIKNAKNYELQRSEDGVIGIKVMWGFWNNQLIYQPLIKNDSVSWKCTTKNKLMSSYLCELK